MLHNHIVTVKRITEEDNQMSKLEEQATQQLIELYNRFLVDIERTAPELLGDKYSNPYFISIPENWFQPGKPRILIVGEEGFGKYGCGKQGDAEYLIPYHDIEKIQNLNRTYLKIQLGKEEGTLNRSPFWGRLRQIAKYGECAWSNIDKIHLLRERNCKLSNNDRKLLHSIDTRLLSEEIAILNPTHVVFFGWYGVSLQHELPSLFEKMYPNGLGDNSVWNKDVVAFEEDGRYYIFAYHPNWGCRHRGYEEKVITAVKAHL